MIVVSDTSPINYLLLLGHIDLLSRLYERITLPPAVLEELLDPAAPGVVRAWAEHLPGWATVRAPRAIDPSLDVDRGESAAISLAVELSASLLLLDDQAGAAAARARGIDVIGTIGVLRRGHDRGLLEFWPTMARLLGETTFRISTRFLQQLQQQYPD